MKQLIFSALVLATVAGCGTTPTALSGSPAASQIAAMGKSTTSPSFEAGLAAGLAKAAASNGTQAPAKAEPIVRGETDQVEFDRGYVMGMIRGTMAAFSRMTGNQTVDTWANMAKMSYAAMTDALKAINDNPELAAKYSKAVGILEGGIASYDAMGGSFNASTWKAFFYANAEVLKNTHTALSKK